MLDQVRLNEVLKGMSGLSEEQKAVLLKAAEKPVHEQELFEKLGVSEQVFGEIMKASAKEEQVFEQEVSETELSAVSGGSANYCKSAVNINCARSHFWNIYENGFPHCASTVEDGSWCWDVDACYSDSIEYVEMKDCTKAWR